MHPHEQGNKLRPKKLRPRPRPYRRGRIRFNVLKRLKRRSGGFGEKSGPRPLSGTGLWASLRQPLNGRMSDVESFITAQVAEENVERDGEQLMTKQEIEALGQAMLNEHGLSDWRVRAVSEDGSCDEDDIAGSYGRTYHEERLIWVNLRYATDPT